MKIGKITHVIDGEEVSEDEFRRRSRAKKGAPSLNGAWRTPLLPDAAGVHPDQIKEAMEHDRKMGVPTDYTPDGRPVITSREHYRRYCQANGLYMRNAGYGDAAPRYR